MGSLRDKTVSGMFWSLLQKVGSRGILFVVMIVLARLLTPNDFGLIGMLTIFIQVSQTLIDGGFNMALIQKKTVDDEDYSSVFYINLLVSSTLYLIIFAGAPLVARFYHQPILTSLLRVLSLILVVNAFSYVQEARLTKEIRFKTLAIIHVPSTIIGGTLGIVMAMLKFGVWSIIAAQVSVRLVYAIQIWIYAKWKPMLSFSIERAKSLFSFGSKLLIGRLTTTLYNNIFLVIIGKFFPLSTVGYYQNSFNLVTTPSSTLTSVLNGVTFPIFASIQDDNSRLKVGYRRVMQQVFFWVCPAYVFAGVLATPLFHLIFTEKWAPAVPYFRWLCVIGILQPLSTYNLNILSVKGRSDMFLKLQLNRRLITLVAIALAVPFGMWALMMVQSVSAIYSFLLFSYHAGKFIEYSLTEQVKDILPVFLLSIVIGAVILLVDQTLAHFSIPVRVFVGTGLSSSLYLLSSKYFKFSPYEDFKIIFHNRITSRFFPGAV